MTQTIDRNSRAVKPAESTATRWLADLERTLAAGDTAAAAGLFHEESHWRDLVAFTWNIKSLDGRAEITAMLDSVLANVRPARFALDVAEGGADEADGIISARFLFETAVGRGHGLLRLRDGRAWTLLTALHELKGFEEPQGERRPKGTEHGVATNRVSWLERRQKEARELGYGTQPEVVIIGGGQGGIILGARLRQLGVPTIILERNARPGDSWRNRYKSLCLHDPVWYDHLPYLEFPKTWPVFTPKDKLGDWLEFYATTMELNYWGSSECVGAAYDQAGREWTVEVVRDGTPVSLRPKQLVLATGVSGKPAIPAFPGADRFVGEQHHSSRHPGPDGYRGKKAVVIGSNNSAHDICAALWEYGADVTMVQRSSSLVVKSESIVEIGLGDLYSERALAAGMTTHRADTIFASQPYRIMHLLQKPISDAIRERDAEFYARLEKVGFLLDFGEDDSGLFLKYLRRGSGYYIDVGASELVANGSIALQSGKGVREITERSVVLEDGTNLPADLIVYATGFEPMNSRVSDLINQEVADKVGRVWGLGSDTAKDPGPWEGEQRNMWKPTRQPGLWFHGGNLHFSRYYSLFLALQLKARHEGIPTPVYGLQTVHHTA
ncbi:flavin-containing monooxygenase [Mycobacterium vicinigordonae]|uniref:NAD(P)/FAD-dependent oxidoreductase n=1 Tax=Mycobacterium vicinigordonae TaxID=1719132 RepID=A0A7D6DWG7_9MYCO|nr:NAD(P)/FAD-dependent oxidoreductase [Mycobacterium vicinigordonae]QLL06504.1 NAD(P)/FAD-dependent oxidoreductase [Mycobacterium vicinigordonae]